MGFFSLVVKNNNLSSIYNFFPPPLYSPSTPPKCKKSGERPPRLCYRPQGGGTAPIEKPWPKTMPQHVYLMPQNLKQCQKPGNEAQTLENYAITTVKETTPLENDAIKLGNEVKTRRSR